MRVIRAAGRLIQVEWLFEPRDLWVGLYWTRLSVLTADYAVYLCLVPMLPIKVSVYAVE